MIAWVYRVVLKFDKYIKLRPSCILEQKINPANIQTESKSVRSEYCLVPNCWNPVKKTTDKRRLPETQTTEDTESTEKKIYLCFLCALCALCGGI